jgi:ParB family chromosome partitioning protein
MSKNALGRGLDALITGGVVRSVAAEAPHVGLPRPIAAEPGAATGEVVRQLKLDAIHPNRFQPRTEFAPEQLHELAESIKQKGVLQPLTVRPVAGKDGQTQYELIAGERRWRASREVGLATVPAIVRTASDEEALELALIENLQREDLNAIEEAKAYAQLIAQFKLTQEQVAEKVGRNRATVANAIRLLGLPPEVQAWVSNNQLSVGHAKAILGLTIGEEQKLVAERVLRQGLTVRETEQLVEHLKGEVKTGARKPGAVVKASEILALEERLQQKLGTRVNIRHGKNKGRIEIEYYNNDDLSRLLTAFGVEPQ